jgi:hypothetical protein
MNWVVFIRSDKQSRAIIERWYVNMISMEETRPVLSMLYALAGADLKLTEGRQSLPDRSVE